MEHFTWFDTIVVTILALSTLLGLYRGFIGIVLGLISFISAIFISSIIYPYVLPFINKYVEDEIILPIVCASIVYIICLIICSLIASKIRSLLPTKGLVDRLFGFILGLIRGGAICLILFSCMIIFFTSSYLEAKTMDDIVECTTKDKYPKWLKKSLSTKYLDMAYHNLTAMISRQTLQSIKLPDKKKQEDIMDLIEKSEKNKQKKHKTKDSFFGKEFEVELDDK